MIDNNPLLNTYTAPQSQLAKEKKIHFINDRIGTSHISVSSQGQHISLTREIAMADSIKRVYDLKKRYRYIYDTFSEEISSLFNNRMCLVVSRLMENKVEIHDISLDTFSEDSFIVSFAKRDDVKLTINLNEPDQIMVDGEIVNNVEVAYLTFNEGGKRRIINNTLRNILTELNSML